MSRSCRTCRWNSRNILEKHKDYVYLGECRSPHVPPKEDHVTGEMTYNFVGEQRLGEFLPLRNLLPMSWRGPPKMCGPEGYYWEEIKKDK